MVAWPTALTATSAATVTPSVEAHGSRAEAALEVDRGGAGAGADAAEGELLRSGVECGAAERRVGRGGPPVLVAAVQEVEEDGGRNDRHAGRTDGKAAAGFCEAGHDAAGGVEAEGGAAGEHHRIDRSDRLLRRQQVGVAGARRPAHDVTGSDRRLVAQHHRDARLEAGIVSVADAEAGDVGEEVLHGRSSGQGAVNCRRRRAGRRATHRERSPAATCRPWRRR